MRGSMNNPSRKTRLLILPSGDMAEVLDIPWPLDPTKEFPHAVWGVVAREALEDFGDKLREIVVRPQIKLTEMDQRAAAAALYALTTSGFVPDGPVYAPMEGSPEECPSEIAVTRAWGGEISSSELSLEDLSELIIYVIRYKLAERVGSPRLKDIPT